MLSSDEHSASSRASQKSTRHLAGQSKSSFTASARWQSEVHAQGHPPRTSEESAECRAPKSHDICWAHSPQRVDTGWFAGCGAIEAQAVPRDPIRFLLGSWTGTDSFGIPSPRNLSDPRTRRVHGALRNRRAEQRICGLLGSSTQAEEVDDSAVHWTACSLHRLCVTLLCSSQVEGWPSGLRRRS